MLDDLVAVALVGVPSGKVVLVVDSLLDVLCCLEKLGVYLYEKVSDTLLSIVKFNLCC